MAQSWRKIVKVDFVLTVLSLKTQDLSKMNKHKLEVSNIINFRSPAQEVGGNPNKDLVIYLDSKRSKVQIFKTTQPLKIRLLSGAHRKSKHPKSVTFSNLSSFPDLSNYLASKLVRYCKSFRAVNFGHNFKSCSAVWWCSSEPVELESFTKGNGLQESPRNNSFCRDPIQEL